MTIIRFISGEAALHDFLHGIMSETETALDDRNINASGKLKASNQTEVFNESGFTVGKFSALSYWVNAGSGTRRGTLVKLDDLKGWLLDKGLVKELDARAVAIAKKIQDDILHDGSRDFVMNNPNVYRESVREAEPRIANVLLAFARDINDPVATEFRKAFA